MGNRPFFVFSRNIVPYSCYELASMLLQQDASSAEGAQLLEQCVSYPAHEFQGRLRLIAGELAKSYGRGAAVEEPHGITPPGVRAGSAQLKEKLVLHDR